MNFHLIPDWSDQVVETYEFRTSIFTTRSGREQRVAERLQARRQLSFSALLWKDLLPAFQALLHDRGATTVVIPDPARFAAVLAEDAAGTAAEIRLTFAPPWLQPGQVLVLSDNFRSEFVTTAVVSNYGSFAVDFSEEDFDRSRLTRATLTAPLVQSWPAGTSLRPSIEGRFAKQVTLEYLTDMTARAPLSFSLSPPAATVEFGSASPTVYNSREVLLVQPNWTQPPNVIHETAFEEVDYGRGITRTYLPVEFYTRTTQFEYLGRSHAEVGDVLGLFVRMRGRQGEFYCPSWVTDMVLSGSIVGGSSQFTVYGSRMYNSYNTSTVNRAIGILLGTGEWLFRQVTAIAEVSTAGAGSFGLDFDESFDGGEAAIFSRFTVSASFPPNIYRDEVVMVCWLNVCRFASDSLVVRWSTDDVAQVLAQIMTLEALTPET